MASINLKNPSPDQKARAAKGGQPNTALQQLHSDLRKQVGTVFFSHKIGCYKTLFFVELILCP